MDDRAVSRASPIVQVSWWAWTVLNAAVGAAAAVYCAVTFFTPGTPFDRTWGGVFFVASGIMLIITIGALAIVGRQRAYRQQGRGMGTLLVGTLRVAPIAVSVIITGAFVVGLALVVYAYSIGAVNADLLAHGGHYLVSRGGATRLVSYPEYRQLAIGGRFASPLGATLMIESFSVVLLLGNRLLPPTTSAP